MPRPSRRWITAALLLGGGGLYLLREDVREGLGKEGAEVRLEPARRRARSPGLPSRHAALTPPGGASDRGAFPPPSPPCRTNWTRLVPVPVLSGHVSSDRGAGHIPDDPGQEGAGRSRAGCKGGGAGAAAIAGAPLLGPAPAPPPPFLVLSGHAASLTSY